MYHKIHYQIYQKPHHKYMYPHFSSNHPQHIFAGIIKTETTQYSRLSSTFDDYNFIRKLFTLRLTTLDYPTKLINDNSFPFLPYNSHNEEQNTNRIDRPNNTQLLSITKQNTTNIFFFKYNKHAQTDKIVQHILHKYHNKQDERL